MIYQRFLKSDILKACKHFPAILITGARQVGKSTLAMELSENYVTLDDITALHLAKNDPQLFIAGLKTPIVIDEIQKAPELFSAIKIAIDRDRKAGQFILTGSANVMAFKNISDTLAGRIAIFELSPLAQMELYEAKKPFLESLFEGSIFEEKEAFRDEGAIYQRILDGFYPEMVKLEDAKMKYLWLSSYIATYIERDIRDIENIRNIDKFARLIHLLASRSANILNKSDLAKEAALDIKTLENYISLLELVYQIKRVRPYFANIGKRFVKSEKLFFTDTGILCHLLGIKSVEALFASPFLGAVFETFIFGELQKQKSFLEGIELFYYRTHDKKEIDFIIEKEGEIVALEAKFAKNITKKDFRHILDLQENCKNLKYGIILYTGERVLQFDERLFCVPAGML